MSIDERIDKRACCALFRINTQPSSSQPAKREAHPITTDGSGAVRQERLVIPLNRIMGRNQLEQPRASLPIYSPGEGGDELFVAPTLDYFDNRASREHCMIELDEGQNVCVRDLGSSYGTLLCRDQGQGKDLRWDLLTPGVSYGLKAGYRLRLGVESSVEYEYVGTTPDIHIRLRYWSRDIVFPLECTPFEWVSIPTDGGQWSSAQILGEGGQPLHDGPHLTVRTSLGEVWPVARVELEATEVSAQKDTVQLSGSMIHGADLDTSGEPDVLHNFRVGYELLLPGPSSKATGLGFVNHTFLSPQRLKFHAVLDAQGWLSFVAVGYAHVQTPESYRTPVEFKGDRSYDTSSLPVSEPHTVSEIARRGDDAKKPSLSKAIVVALLEQRRLDLLAGAGAEAGWVSRQAVARVLGEEFSEEKFQNNFTKWRSELSKKLKITASSFRETRSKTCGIPEEVDWTKFAESRTEEGRLFVRLCPMIELELLQG